MKLYRCYSERMCVYFIDHKQERLLKAKDIKTGATLWAFEETDELLNLKQQYDREVLHK